MRIWMVGQVEGPRYEKEEVGLQEIKYHGRTMA